MYSQAGELLKLAAARIICNEMRKQATPFDPETYIEQTYASDNPTYGDADIAAKDNGIIQANPMLPTPVWGVEHNLRHIPRPGYDSSAMDSIMAHTQGLYDQQRRNMDSTFANMLRSGTMPSAAPLTVSEALNPRAWVQRGMRGLMGLFNR